MSNSSAPIQNPAEDAAGRLWSIHVESGFVTAGFVAHFACRLCAVIVCGAGLAACGPVGGGAAGAAGSARGAAEAAYRPPPTILAAERASTGAVLLVGKADSAAHVRLAAPTGALTPAATDGRGLWRARLPPSGAVRLFGLAAITAGRTVQAEGYLALPPTGPAAQLRAGAGALVLDGRGSLRILALDFDRKGGAVVSGAAPPGANLAILADGAARGRLAADREGRFALAFDEPLSQGSHRFEVSDGVEHSEVAFAVTPSAPLTDAPFRAVRADSAWRIDWVTPGGGIQTTVLFSPKEGPA